jgi:transcriptional regulator with XRE-family HTH domain
MSPVNVGAIGAYIREQREQAKISLRQLAQSAGISNPYLSQIERGLRRPSADILQQIAKGLRISAEALYVQAGFLEDRPPGSVVREAVLTDQELTERQKQMLIEIYESFRKETLMSRAGTAGIVDDQTGLDPDEAALTWPDDRIPAAIAGRQRLALAAPTGTEDEDDPRDAWSWTADDAEFEDDPLAGVAQGPWAVASDDADAETGTGARAGADAGADADAGTGPHADAGTGPDAGAGTGTDAGADTGTETEAGTETETGNETVTSETATGEGDAGATVHPFPARPGNG